MIFVYVLIFIFFVYYRPSSDQPFTFPADKSETTITISFPKPVQVGRVSLINPDNILDYNVVYVDNNNQPSGVSVSKQYSATSIPRSVLPGILRYALRFLSSFLSLLQLLYHALFFQEHYVTRFLPLLSCLLFSYLKYT
jgi:hypothetical protein